MGLTDPIEIVNLFSAGVWANASAGFIAADLTLVLIASFIFYAAEGMRIGMKRWYLYIPATFAISFAFSFGLFMFNREKTIQRVTTTVVRLDPPKDTWWVVLPGVVAAILCAWESSWSSCCRFLQLPCQPIRCVKTWPVLVQEVLAAHQQYLQVHRARGYWNGLLRAEDSLHCSDDQLEPAQAVQTRFRLF